MRMIAIVVVSAAAIAACGRSDTQSSAPKSIHGLPMADRAVDSATGRALFIEKGCVICHSVNGVGGKAAPALDAPIGASEVDALDFAARMWLGAPAMIELQSVEMGYVINLTADEIAHLAAFSADVAEQKQLKPEAIPEPMRGWLLDERFWEVENWDEFLGRGQEGYETPPPDKGDGETP